MRESSDAVAMTGNQVKGAPSLTDEGFAFIAALSAFSRAIDPTGRVNGRAVELMRAAAGLANIDAPTREAVLQVARFLEAARNG